MDNEKLEQALKLKERGTAFLNQGKFKLAISKVIQFIFKFVFMQLFSTMQLFPFWNSPNQHSLRTQKAAKNWPKNSNKLWWPLG